MSSFKCFRCGETHSGLPFGFEAEAPFYVLGISETERKLRCQLTEDTCVIDKEDYFIKGTVALTIEKETDPFIWTVWVSLSELNFERYVRFREDPSRVTEEPYFGWFSTTLPVYPDTLNLKTNVHMQEVGLLSYIVLQPTDHPLAIEQRNGITRTRWQEIAETLLHS